MINLYDGSGYWGIIAKSLHSNKKPIALLLITAGADPEIIPANQPERRAIKIAIKNNDLDMVKILSDVGAKIYEHDLLYSTSSKMKEIIREKIHKNITPTDKITNNYTEKQKEEDSSVAWEKVDNDTISKTVETSKSRLQTIFNFKASRIMHVYENLDVKTRQVIHRHSPIIEYFNKVQNAAEIEEAYDKLVSLGGSPNPKFKDKNYKTIRKINTNNKPN